MSEITWEPSEKHEDCLNGYTTSGSLAYVIFCEDAGFRLINYKAGLATMGVFASEEAAKEAAEAHEAPDEAGSQPTHIPPGCRGEACTLCGAQALHKVAEERESLGVYHGSTAYLCEACFARVMRPWDLPRFEKPEPAPSGSTAAIVDGLRKMADDLSGRMLLERIEGFLVTRDWSDEAKQCAAAADHVEDLADKLTTAERDIERLNLAAENAMANLNAVSAWLDWARSLQASGGQMLTPAGLLQAYPGTLLAIHPQPHLQNRIQNRDRQQREETPAP